MNHKKILSFVYNDICQACINENCNIAKVQEIYCTEEKENEPLSKIVKEINKFELDLENVTCKNYVFDKNNPFSHIIEVHYKNGRVEKQQGWCSVEGIAKIWSKDKNIDYISILFTDV